MNQNVNEALSCLENESKQLLKQSERMFLADHGKLYRFDLLVVGVIKRTAALSDGFSLLIREKNFICAGAIICMHLDTALRLSAGFRVDSPHDFARKIMEGHRINKMKDKDGNLMHDSHLRKILSEELPWVNSVYEKTSNFIHFSSTHIFSAADPNHKMKDESTHRLFIGPKDTNASDENYLDAITVFRSITPIISHYIEGWILAKDHSSNSLNDEIKHVKLNI